MRVYDPNYERLRAGGTVERYTPPEIFTALGLTFDLDVAAPPGGVAWVPAGRALSASEDGLSMPWTGRVWVNPPYGRGIDRWLTRLADHGDGVALVFGRTDTNWWGDAARRATAVCFVRGRVRFIDGRTGEPGEGRAPIPSTLLAYGLVCATALIQSGLGPTFLVPAGASA